MDKTNWLSKVRLHPRFPAILAGIIVSSIVLIGAIVVAVVLLVKRSGQVSIVSPPGTDANSGSNLPFQPPPRPQIPLTEAETKLQAFERDFLKRWMEYPGLVTRYNRALKNSKSKNKPPPQPVTPPPQLSYQELKDHLEMCLDRPDTRSKQVQSFRTKANQVALTCPDITKKLTEQDVDHWSLRPTVDWFKKYQQDYTPEVSLKLFTILVDSSLEPNALENLFKELKLDLLTTSTWLSDYQVLLAAWRELAGSKAISGPKDATKEKIIKLATYLNLAASHYNIQEEKVTFDKPEQIVETVCWSLCVGSLLKSYDSHLPDDIKSDLEGKLAHKNLVGLDWGPFVDPLSSQIEGQEGAQAVVDELRYPLMVLERLRLKCQRHTLKSPEIGDWISNILYDPNHVITIDDIHFLRLLFIALTKEQPIIPREENGEDPTRAMDATAVEEWTSDKHKDLVSYNNAYRVKPTIAAFMMLRGEPSELARLIRRLSSKAANLMYNRYMLPADWVHLLQYVKRISSQVLSTNLDWSHVKAALAAWGTEPIKNNMKADTSAKVNTLKSSVPQLEEQRGSPHTFFVINSEVLDRLSKSIDQGMVDSSFNVEIEADDKTRLMSYVNFLRPLFSLQRTYRVDCRPQARIQIDIKGDPLPNPDEGSLTRQVLQTMEDLHIRLLGNTRTCPTSLVSGIVSDDSGSGDSRSKGGSLVIKPGYGPEFFRLAVFVWGRAIMEKQTVTAMLSPDFLDVLITKGNIYSPDATNPSLDERWFYDDFWFWAVDPLYKLHPGSLCRAMSESSDPASVVPPDGTYDLSGHFTQYRDLGATFTVRSCSAADLNATLPDLLSWHDTMVTRFRLDLDDHAVQFMDSFRRFFEDQVFESTVSPILTGDYLMLAVGPVISGSLDITKIIEKMKTDSDPRYDISKYHVNLPKGEQGEEGPSSTASKQAVALTAITMALNDLVDEIDLEDADLGSGLLMLLYGKRSLPPGGYSDVRFIVVYDDATSLPGQFVADSNHQRLYLPKTAQGAKPTSDNPLEYDVFKGALQKAIERALHPSTSHDEDHRDEGEDGRGVEEDSEDEGED